MAVPSNRHRMPENTEELSSYDVFLSHAGEQKYHYADHVRARLKQEYPDVRFFLDEKSLQPGKRSASQIQRAMETCAVAVIVLSAEFVCKRHPMSELDFLLERWRRGEVTIIPMLYENLSCPDIDALEAKYKDETWVPKYQRRAEGKHCYLKDTYGKALGKTTEQWAAVVKEVWGITALRWDQDKGGAAHISKLVECIVDRLAEKGRKVMQHAAVELPRNVVGLEQRVAEVIKRLKQHRVVLVHGMGGIGKSTLLKAVYSKLIGRQGEFRTACAHRLYLTRGMCNVKGLLKKQKHLMMHLGFAEARVQQVSDLEEGRLLIREEVRKRRMLIVLDNVQVEEEHGGNQLHHLLPDDLASVLAEKDGWMLVSSRQPDCASAFNADQLRVDELDGESSLQLFCYHTFGPPDSGRCSPPAAWIQQEDHKEALKDVMSVCRGLPMALEVVGMYLKGKAVSEWKAWRSAFDKQPSSHSDGRITLFACFGISFDKLSVEQQQLLIDISFILRKGVVSGFQWSWWDVEAYCKEHLQQLLNSGFIKPQPEDVSCDMKRGPKTVAVMHDTVMEFCKQKALDKAKYGQMIGCGDKGDSVVDLKDIAALHTEGVDLTWHCPAPHYPLCRLMILEYVKLHSTPPASFPHLRCLALHAVKESSTRTRRIRLGLAAGLQAALDGMTELRLLRISGCGDSLTLPVLNNLRTLELHQTAMNATNLQKITTLEHLRIFDCPVRTLPELSSLRHLRRLRIADAAPLPSSFESIRGLAALTHLFIHGDSTMAAVWLGRSLVELELSDCERLQQLLGVNELHALTNLQLKWCPCLTKLQLSSQAHLRRLEVVMCGVQHLGLGQLTALTRLGLGGCPSLQHSQLIYGLPSLKELVMTCKDTLNHLPALSKLASLTKLEVEDLYPLPKRYHDRWFDDRSYKQLFDLRLRHLTVLEVVGCSSLQQLHLGSALTSLHKLRVQGARKLQMLSGLSHLNALKLLEVDECAALTEASWRELGEALARLPAKGPRTPPMKHRTRPCKPGPATQPLQP